MWIRIRYGCVFHSGCDSFPPIKTESSGCQVLVVRRNMLSTRQTACWWSLGRHAGQAQYGRAAYAIRTEERWTLDSNRKKQGMLPGDWSVWKCMTKRGRRWRKQSQGVAHRPCRRDLQIQETGGLRWCDCTFRGKRESETQDELNTTQECSTSVLRAVPSKQALTQRKITSLPACWNKSQRHDNDSSVEVCFQVRS